MARSIQTSINIHMDRMTSADKNTEPIATFYISDLSEPGGTITIRICNADDSYGGVCMFMDRRDVEALQRAITDYLETAPDGCEFVDELNGEYYATPKCITHAEGEC